MKRPGEGRARAWAEEDTHHLIQGVAQEAVLVEDEEPPLPFLQRNTDWVCRRFRPCSPLTESLCGTNVYPNSAGPAAATSEADGRKGGPTVEERRLMSQTGPEEKPECPLCFHTRS